MNNNTILLVEDNPDDVELTLEAFSRNKIANPIYVVSDGAAALDYVMGRGKFEGANRPPLPSLILLDLNLPKVPGLEVLRAVRADSHTHLIPTVILTTSIEDKDVIEGYGLGANAYVQKPVGFEEFVVAVGRLGMFWTLTNVAPPNQ